MYAQLLILSNDTKYCKRSFTCVSKLSDFWLCVFIFLSDRKGDLYQNGIYKHAGKLSKASVGIRQDLERSTTISCFFLVSVLVKQYSNPSLATDPCSSWNMTTSPVTICLKQSPDQIFQPFLKYRSRTCGGSRRVRACIII